MKRIISMGFAALVILSALVVLDIGPVGIVRASGDPVWNGSYWETTGDWVVGTGSTIYTYTSTTIVVNGHLTIDPGYTLTLQNVTLIMNSPYNGAYNITVRGSDSAIFPGGNLTIENVGANPSVITNNGTGQFGFHVEASPQGNANLWMRNSKLLHCGWDLSEPVYSDGGLWIAGDATVEYSDISEGYAGIVIYGGDDPGINPTIQYNTIHDNPEGAGIYLSEVMGPLVGKPLRIGPGNDINTSYWGIFAELCSNLTIHNNSIHDNGLGGINDGGGLKITEASSDIFIEDNNITANWHFNIYGINSANIFVYRNEVNGSTNFTSFETIDGLDIRNNYFCQGGANVNTTYLFGYDITDCIFDNNVVNNNMGIGALFNYVQVEITDNRFENNPSVGIGLQLGSYNSIIDGNKIINNSDIGLFLAGNNNTIRNNEFRNNGDGTFLGGMPDFQDSGFCALNSYDIYLYDNEFIDNVQTTGSDEVDGVYLYGSEITTSAYMWNNTMNKNQYNLHCRGGVEAYDTNSTYIKNTSFVDSYEVYLEQTIEAEGPNHVTFLNTTFDNSSVYIEGESDHAVQWYKHIKVEDNLGNPIPNASIWTNDSFGNNEGASGATTDSDGRLKFIPLTEYVENATTRTLHTPHSIDIIDPTRVGYDEANMWHSHYNTIVLNERPTVTDMRTELGPIGSVYRTNTITIFVEGSDLEDSNLDLIPFIEYRVNETSPWVDETSAYFGSWSYDTGNAWWTITFTPPTDAPIDTYGFHTRLEDTYPSYSDWYVVDGMVDVLNNPPLTIWVGEGASAVYRGASVYADGDDIEDNGEDDTWDAQCEYRLNGSSSWTDIYISQSIWDSTSNHWRFTFEPSATRPDPNHGPVDFRVRFMDSDGTWNSTWYEISDLVHILNNLPIAQNLEPSNNEVHRGESIWIFANASDMEQIENSLVVEFWWDAPGGGEIWEQTYLGSVQWDSGGFFKVEFTPDQNMVKGYYKFRVRITDSEGDYNEMTENAMVNVMNQPPVPLSITPSAPTVRAGADYIYLYINASDYEDFESDLTVTVQWQYNETSPQGWSGAYITVEPYEGSAPSGWLKVRFTPDSNMQLGRYDLRVKVEDTDGDESVNPQWIAIYRAVEVQNPEPTLENVALGDHEVYRGQTLYLFLNASDLGEPEPDLTPEMEWLSPGGFWDDTNLMMYYEDTNGNLNDDIGYWVIEFTPLTTAILGEYQFRARVRNSAGGISDGGDWETGSKWTTGNTADVLNNEPIAIDLWVVDSTVTRGDYIFIWADGVDFEDDSDDLIPHFEYREEGGLWDDSYLTGLTFNIVDDTWRITFSPPADPSFSVGLYDFRVWFEDMDGGVSNIVEEGELVTVENASPSVLSLTIPESEGFRMESITIIADGKDDDHGESALDAIFEYKGPNDSDWTGSDDIGTYFKGTPTYFNGHWQIDFEPPAEADTGDYSFRVAFSDGIDTTTYMEKTDAYNLQNQAPEVEITSPKSGTQTSKTIDFEVDVNDDKDTSFDYDWDFDDGSATTDEESPTHTFEPGDYTVTVTVTDSDGSKAIDTVTITLNESLFNEVPIVDDLTVPPTSYRLKIYAIVADGSDADGSEAALTPEFQYKDPSENWTGYGDSGSYFQDPPEYSNGHWVISFSPPADAPIGQYSFRVRFSDDYSTSGWLWKNDTLTMINNAPEVVDLTVPSSGYRFEAIYISANGSDDDGSEYALIPIFQYKGPHDSNWISYGDSGSYFTGSPQYTNGYWRIEFTPYSEADLGLYSFRVQFADDYHSSQWSTKLDSFTLNNNIPTVQIIAPSSGEQFTSSITFMATASDIEDSTLAFQWDFGDGSFLLSTDESPTYNYTANGTYTVTVMVTDGDGGTASDTISIIIPEIGDGNGDGDSGDGGGGDGDGDGGDGGDGEDGTGKPGEKDEEEDLMQWLFLLIIIILVGIILLLLFMRKKKPGEGLPEEAEAEGEPSEDIDLKDTIEPSEEEESFSEVEDKELDELTESPAIPPTTSEETIEENPSEKM